MMSSLLFRGKFASSLAARNRSASSMFSTVVYSWGTGTSGQLGHAKFEKSTSVMGTEYIQEEPRKMIKSKRFQNIAVGNGFSIGLTRTGELFGWGERSVVKHDSPSESILEPIPITLDMKFKNVAAGNKHAAAVDTNGRLWTWGDNGGWYRGGGMLGVGDREARMTPTLVESLKDYGAKIASVSCGERHTVILTDDGEVLTCGGGEYGRQGTGNSSDAMIPMPVTSLPDDIVQVAAGCDHTLALTSSGTLFSWGKNNSGQLGHADSMLDMYSMEEFPKVVDTEGDSDGSRKLPPIKQVAAGNGRSAAVTMDGQLYVWGVRLSNAPKLVDNSAMEYKKVVKVAIGGDLSHSVIAFITEDGGLWAMGDGASNMLGNAGKTSGKQPLPKRVSSLENKQVVDISCGLGTHMFAFVKTDDE